MHVIKVDQAAMKANGRIILGKTLPCIRRKTGHFECLSRSRGPCYCPTGLELHGSPVFQGEGDLRNTDPDHRNHDG